MVEHAGEARGGEARALVGDRLAVGEAHAHDLEHECADREVERHGRLGIRFDRGGREHASVGREPLASEIRRQAGHAAQVALDLAGGDERATGSARLAAHRAHRLQRSERGAQRRPADAVVLGEIALATEAFTGCERATGDLAQDPIAHADASRAELPGGTLIARWRGCAQIASMADGASGSVWPPSTTIVWPVMNLASSVARNMAA